MNREREGQELLVCVGVLVVALLVVVLVMLFGMALGPVATTCVRMAHLLSLVR